MSIGVMAGILLVAGFMAVQFSPRASAPSKAAAPTTAAVDYGAPLPSVRLIWVQDPNHAGGLIGFDWTGQPRGIVKRAQPLGEGESLAQSPDGSTFAYTPAAKGGYQQFLDRFGNPLPGLDSSVRSQSQMWADDSRHMCALDFSGGLGGQWMINLRLPGAAPTSGSVVGLDPTIVQSGIIALSLVACSVRNDRAVIEYNYFGRPTEFWIVRISDGAIVQQHTYATGELVSVTASPGGDVIAENSGKSACQAAPAAASTFIRHASDLSAITTLDPSIGVLGFNSDGSLALVTLTPQAPGTATDLAVIDANNGNVVWRYKGTEQFSTYLEEPDGVDIAVMTRALGDTSIHPSVSIVIVRGRTGETNIPGRYPLL